MRRVDEAIESSRFSDQQRQEYWCTPRNRVPGNASIKMNYLKYKW